MKKVTFRYGDRVKVTSGFYKGFVGILIQGDSDQNWFNAKLEAKADKNTVETVWVGLSPKDIKLVKKNTSTPK